MITPLPSNVNNYIQYSILVVHYSTLCMFESAYEDKLKTLNSSEYISNLVYFAVVILRKQLYSNLVQREETHIKPGKYIAGIFQIF